jgi:hypothetical protein
VVSLVTALSRRKPLRSDLRCHTFSEYVVLDRRRYVLYAGGVDREMLLLDGRLIDGSSIARCVLVVEIRGFRSAKPLLARKELSVSGSFGMCTFSTFTPPIRPPISSPPAASTGANPPHPSESLRELVMSHR